VITKIFTKKDKILVWLVQNRTILTKENLIHRAWQCQFRDEEKNTVALYLNAVSWLDKSDLGLGGGHVGLIFIIGRIYK
jgi:hypothetical protein